jgi:hypothetical protein
LSLLRNLATFRNKQTYELIKLESAGLKRIRTDFFSHLGPAY